MSRRRRKSFPILRQSQSFEQIMCGNPFPLSYGGPTFFCDRVHELERVRTHLFNGLDVILTGPQFAGKTVFVKRLFDDEEMQAHFHCLSADFSDVRHLDETVGILREACRPLLGASLPSSSEPSRRSRAAEVLHQRILAEVSGLFQALGALDKPVILALDEFSQLALLRDRHQAEAVFRTALQASPRISAVFTGSDLAMLGAMFRSPIRPFFMTGTFANLDPIKCDVWAGFAESLFEENGKHCPQIVFREFFALLGKRTGLVQRWLHELFRLTPEGGTADLGLGRLALEAATAAGALLYRETFGSLGRNQRSLMTALAFAGSVPSVTDPQFLSSCGLTAAQARGARRTLAGQGAGSLIETERLPNGTEQWRIIDAYFARWIRQQGGSADD